MRPDSNKRHGNRCNATSLVGADNGFRPRRPATPRGSILSSILSLLLLLVVAAPAAPAAPATQPAGQAAAVRKLVFQLDDDDPEVRTRASLRVNNLDASALGVLEEALKSPDLSPEAQARLQVAVKYVRPRAAVQRQRQARAQWEARTLHEAYQKTGRTGPAYDAEVHRAIDLFLKLGPDALRGPAAPREAALSAFRAAADKGCKDPLVACLQAAADGRDGDGPLVGPGHRAIAEVARGAYPPAAKLLACVAFLWSTNLADTQMTALPVKLLPDLLKDDTIPPGVLDQVFDSYYDAARRNRNGDSVLFNFVQAYQAARPDAAGPELLAARNFIDIGLEAHDGYGLTGVGRDHMNAAAERLERASRLAPEDWAPPTRMLVVHLYLNSDRETFEKWFQRAMDLNPDNFEACALKLEYLNPARQHRQEGAEEMIRFGRWCLQTKDWHAGIPSLLIRAHHHAAELSSDQSAYLRQPEVWEDGRAVFEGALVNLDEGPAAVSVRSHYAKWAVECEQWTAANKLFSALGDKPDLQPFVSRENYVYARNKARRRAAEPASGTAAPPAAQ